MTSSTGKTGQNHDQCGCCGPVGFEFPEELMTLELKKMREEMGEEAFLEMMKKML